MDRMRGSVVVVLIGALIALAFVTRPGQIGGTSGDVSLTVAGIDGMGGDEQSLLFDPAVTPVPVTEEPFQPTLVVPQSDSSQPTPLALFASELRTPVSGQSSPGNDTLLDGWNPPPLEVPIARHPYDHYWLIRPVGSNHNNFGLPNYAYGTDGPGNDLRIHHGIDIANPIGVEVYAAASGRVIWADKGHFNKYEGITSYGNTVVIEHDFGYRGQPVYTLYAHLSAMLVDKGEWVESGRVVGLIGNTGQVSGPHVHFEVRVGLNWYFAVRNPDLWMAPYVGAGVIAGQVTLEDGEPAPDAPITLINLATGQVVHRTTTYAGSGINADDYWNENFTIPDVPVGRYMVTARYYGETWTGEVEVLAGTTNWVDMKPQNPHEPDGENARDGDSPAQ